MEVERGTVRKEMKVETGTVRKEMEVDKDHRNRGRAPGEEEAT